MNRCRDCGKEGELTGHMECQFPQDHDDEEYEGPMPISDREHWHAGQ